MTNVTSKWTFAVGLALAASLPVMANEFPVIQHGEKFVVPAGTLMCGSQEALERFTVASESERQWLTGACYESARPTRFNSLRELRDGTLLGEGLRGNPRIDRYIQRGSYDAQFETALASN